MKYLNESEICKYLAKSLLGNFVFYFEKQQI